MRYVVEGSVRKLGDVLRVNAQLVATESRGASLGGPLRPAAEGSQRRSGGDRPADRPDLERGADGHRERPQQAGTADKPGRVRSDHPRAIAVAPSDGSAGTCGTHGLVRAGPAARSHFDSRDDRTCRRADPRHASSRTSETSLDARPSSSRTRRRSTRTIPLSGVHRVPAVRPGPLRRGNRRLSASPGRISERPVPTARSVTA